jgi:hypothetical protein
MNYGQALQALLSGKSITCAEFERAGAILGIQPPTGNITESFIFQRRANGVSTPYMPTSAEQLSTNWSVVGEAQQQGRGAAAEQRQHEHVGV